MIGRACLNLNCLGLLLGTIMHVLAKSPTLTLVQASRPLASISKYFRNTAHFCTSHVPQLQRKTNGSAHSTGACVLCHIPLDIPASLQGIILRSAHLYRAALPRSEGIYSARRTNTCFAVTSPSLKGTHINTRIVITFER